MLKGLFFLTYIAAASALAEWSLVAEKRKCANTLWKPGYKRSLEECAHSCRGSSSMFAYGTDDFWPSRCDRRMGACDCQCEMASQSGVCNFRQVYHGGYRLYKYDSVDIDWELKAERKRCGGTRTNQGWKATVADCADSCRGKSSMFSWGTTDFGANPCLDCRGCRCFCEFSSSSGTCDADKGGMIDDNGFRLYSFESEGPAEPAPTTVAPVTTTKPNGECHNDFSSKSAMESNGWVFGWNSNHAFLKGGRVCENVPSTSYCGYRYPGVGVVSYTFSASGTGTLIYGHSWRGGSIHVFLNDKEIGSRSTRGRATLSFSFSAGDILQIKEFGESVINIHSLCTSSQTQGTSWNQIGSYKCDDEHWKGPEPSLDACKAKCEGYSFMIYVERGDRNCACQNSCGNQISCSSPSTCDIYSGLAIEKGFEFKHQGHCAGGWDGNTVQNSLEDCFSECTSRPDVGYFAFKSSNGVCACYFTVNGCPDDNRFNDFNAYRIIKSSDEGNVEGDEWQELQLSKHNTYRATHQSPNMVLDDKLSQDAKDHAERLAAKGKYLSQSDHDENTNDGENIGISCSSGSHPSYDDVTDKWYSEEKDYDYDKGRLKDECLRNPAPASCHKAIGHFTQVVWKGSVKLGIGKATGRVGNWNCTWAVGRYSPAGNTGGQFQKNVLRPSK